MKKRMRFFITLILSMALTFSLIITFTACKEGNELVRVFASVNDEVLPEDFNLLQDVSVVFEYKDGRRDILSVRENMLTEEDQGKLKVPGRHSITINYNQTDSIVANVHLLRASDKNTVIDKIIRGAQIAAPQNNINGELDLSFSYAFKGQDSQEYNIRLKFTLDIDRFEGSENYIEIEISENGNTIFALYYKDNSVTRPYMYVKIGGPFGEILSATQNKFPSVSADSYFGEASVPAEEDFFSFEEILDAIMSLVGDDIISVPGIKIEGLVNGLLDLLLSGAAVADDGSVAVIRLDIQEALESPIFRLAAALILTQPANQFLTDIGSPLDFMGVMEALAYQNLTLKATFNEDGALNNLRVAELDNQSQAPIKLLSIDDKDAKASVKVNAISLTANDSYYDLPEGKDLQGWQESEVSFERWLLLQYRQILGGGYKPPMREDIKGFIDIPYGESGNEYNLLDVYRPKDKEGELPVIINIHGGGWVHGSKDDVSVYCQYLASQGFAVVNINYHLMPAAFMPQPMQDVFNVFNFVTDDDNASKYGFDKDNVFLTGDSAGGHYAMLAMSILVDAELQEIYGVQSDIDIKAVGVNSTGFTFTNVLKIPLPFAHYYVNQFFSDDLPYTAYKDDPRYAEMAKSLNLENNKLELFPPMFISSAHADLFKSHSDRLAAELNKRGVEYVYDYRLQNDKDNPERFLLGHDFNVTAPYWTVSRTVNDRLCAFFKGKIG